MRNTIALILLFLSWPVCLIHRYWNNAPIRSVSWILFDKTVNQDFRWYMVYSELMISALFVLLSFLIIKVKTRKLQVVLWALFWVSIVDIANYVLFFRRNEIALTVEGLIMFIGAILIFKHDTTRYKHEKAN